MPQLKSQKLYIINRWQVELKFYVSLYLFIFLIGNKPSKLSIREELAGYRFSKVSMHACKEIK